jgi:hypothetical protein
MVMVSFSLEDLVSSRRDNGVHAKHQAHSSKRQREYQHHATRNGLAPRRMSQAIVIVGDKPTPVPSSGGVHLRSGYLRFSAGT